MVRLDSQRRRLHEMSSIRRDRASTVAAALRHARLAPARSAVQHAAAIPISASAVDIREPNARAGDRPSQRVPAGAGTATNWMGARSAIPMVVVDAAREPVAARSPLMVFIPTTWNPADKSLSINLTAGNLIATATAGGVQGVRGIAGLSSGKFYFEAAMATWVNASSGIGIALSTTSIGSISSGTGIAGVNANGSIFVNGVSTGTSLGARSSGDIVGVAVDLTAKLIWLRVSPGGNWNNSGTANPATGAGGVNISPIATGTIMPYFSPFAINDSANANFGASAFNGTVPAGFTSGWGSQVTTATLSYDYESSNANPAAGFAYQGIANPAQLTFDVIDKNSNDNTAFLSSLTSGYIITCNNVTWTISSVKVQGANVVVTINPPEAALPYGVTNFAFNPVPASELPTFPLFTPIIPTSVFPPGGGVGSIGDPIGVPTFPPPTPPPIGTVPVGPLVGPAISPAPVPPSLAGVVQPQYKTGSATSPTAASWFPQFTTTGAYAGFPNQPPTGVPIVFANISTKPSFSGGVWTVVTPPSTATTAQIILNGWGPPGPSGLGPGPPSYPNPPGAGLPHLASAEDSTSVESGSGLVFPDQPVLFAAVGRRKRVGAIQSGHAKSSK